MILGISFSQGWDLLVVIEELRWWESLNLALNLIIFSITTPVEIFERNRRTSCFLIFLSSLCHGSACVLSSSITTFFQISNPVVFVIATANWPGVSYCYISSLDYSGSLLTSPPAANIIPLQSVFNTVARMSYLKMLFRSWHFAVLEKHSVGWGYSSVVEHLLSTCKVLGSIHSTKKKKETTLVYGVK